MRTPQRTKEKQKRVTLLGVIANGSTDKARKLVRKYGYPDATDYDDLEFKLTQIYHGTEDKLKLEKDLANIHPHKDFIVKYVGSNPAETTMVVEKLSPDTPPLPQCSCGNPYCPANFGGLCSALDVKSNASGCSCSGADGSTSSTNSNPMNDKSLIIGASMIGLFSLGIISIFALTLKKQ